MSAQMLAKNKISALNKEISMEIHATHKVGVVKYAKIYRRKPKCNYKSL